jgi:hypothetical protein
MATANFLLQSSVGFPDNTLLHTPKYDTEAKKREKKLSTRFDSQKNGKFIVFSIDMSRNQNPNSMKPHIITIILLQRTCPPCRAEGHCIVMDDARKPTEELLD